MTVVARRIVVRGRVQGVGYRYAMVTLAREAGVVGWVRNRRDGTVEAHVQGEEQLVARVEAWCRDGPPGAQVSEVHGQSVTADVVLERFAKRATE